MRRFEMPKVVKFDMELWRMGEGSADSYIAWNRGLAETDLRFFSEANDLKVWGSEMVYDGWLDGIKFLSAIVEDSDGNIRRIKWSDNQSWYEKTESGGWGLMSDVRQKGEAA